MSIDPAFERAVLAQFVLHERRALARRRAGHPDAARVLAERLHCGSHDLLLHLRRVALAVPRRYRAVAWLQHAHESDVTRGALHRAKLSQAEVAAVELFAKLAGDRLLRARALSTAPGPSGYLARVVARAAIEDAIRGRRPDAVTLSALAVLPDPRVAR
jgi:hypothetical protein